MFDEIVRDNLTYIDTDTAAIKAKVNSIYGIKPNTTPRSKIHPEKYSDINYDNMSKEELLSTCKFLAVLADSRKQLADNYKYMYFKEAEELDILRQKIGKED